jgi:hypothetical protein
MLNLNELSDHRQEDLPFSKSIAAATEQVFNGLTP